MSYLKPTVLLFFWHILLNIVYVLLFIILNLGIILYLLLLKKSEMMDLDGTTHSGDILVTITPHVKLIQSEKGTKKIFLWIIFP